MEEFVTRDPIAASCKVSDHTRIGRILAMSFVLKTLKLILVITSCSYFFAMSFKILIEIQADVNNWDDFADEPIEDEPEHFAQFYDLMCD